jgi:hypothetical protein
MDPGRAPRLILFLAVAATACRSATWAPPPGTPPRPAATSVDAPAGAPGAPAAASPESTFGRLHRSLSEPGGFFQSDNVVSNETSYLHVLDGLRRIGVRGGAYIGVGPDQNYSYIAAIRPAIAFMFDIRRDNALEHLLFKAAFAMARNRLDYLCILTGRPPPADLDAWNDRSIGDLVAYIDRTGADGPYVRATQREIDHRVREMGIPLDRYDSLTVGRYRSAFIRDGLDVQYSSLDGRIQRNMPGWRSLLLGVDRSGVQGNYLAADSSFRFVQRLHERNLIVPVTGNLAGPQALAAVAAEMRARGEVVSALYLSNVEQYLTRDGSYPRFVENVRSLPRGRTSVIIRSLFGDGYGRHPLAVDGYNSTSLLQYVDIFLEEWDAGRITSYADVVFRAFIER